MVTMLAIALTGWGQMGQLIEKIAPTLDCYVVGKADPPAGYPLNIQDFISADIIIDFSLPESVLDNIKLAVKLKKNMVIGTTGWFDKLEKVTNLINKENLGLIYSTNFSIGMNLFFLITEFCGNLFDQTPEYDPYGLEMHHNKKMDSPSGTARTLAEILMKTISRKQGVQFDRLQHRINPADFHFASIRAGHIPGTHQIGFDSSADSIEIRH
ncbi:MAG: 4-hydroxy-tetrahydrodipicolinate reductase, partial [Candidatus Cloacimonetes bacterium]|nr:4-hydroxy-tetrahydrodipicolinate reductase [Candidatus Cloacimonadota bacterium]